MDTKSQDYQEFSKFIHPESLNCQQKLSLVPKNKSMIVNVPKDMIPNLQVDISINIDTRQLNYLSLVIKEVLEQIFKNAPSAKQYLSDASLVASLVHEKKKTAYLTGQKLNIFLYELKIEEGHTLSIALNSGQAGQGGAAALSQSMPPPELARNTSQSQTISYVPPPNVYKAPPQQNPFPVSQNPIGQNQIPRGVKASKIIELIEKSVKEQLDLFEKQAATDDANDIELESLVEGVLNEQAVLSVLKLAARPIREQGFKKIQDSLEVLHASLDNKHLELENLMKQLAEKDAQLAHALQKIENLALQKQTLENILKPSEFQYTAEEVQPIEINPGETKKTLKYLKNPCQDKKWPSTTILEQIFPTDVPLLADNQMTFQLGEPSGQGKAKFQTLIKAPQQQGEKIFKFRLRESPQGPYFGDEYVVKLKVTQSASEQPPSRFDDFLRQSQPAAAQEIPQISIPQPQIMSVESTQQVIQSGIQRKAVPKVIQNQYKKKMDQDSSLNPLQKELMEQLLQNGFKDFEQNATLVKEGLALSQIMARIIEIENSAPGNSALFQSQYQ